jgi:hypothetical protein
VALEVGELLQAWVAMCWQHLAVCVDVNALQHYAAAAAANCATNM